jgi:hypothetical protein
MAQEIRALSRAENLSDAHDSSDQEADILAIDGNATRAGQRLLG